MSELYELRLALLAATVALGAEQPRGKGCAAVLDAAVRFAAHGSNAVMASISVPADLRVDVRFGAARALNSTCAACGACPRGLGEDAPEPVTLPQLQPPRAV